MKMKDRIFAGVHCRFISSLVSHNFRISDTTMVITKIATKSDFMREGDMSQTDVGNATRLANAKNSSNRLLTHAS